MGFEPTTLRDLVGCSKHLSYWRLYGEQGPICGSRLEPHHAATQPSNDRQSESHLGLGFFFRVLLKLISCHLQSVVQNGNKINGLYSPSAMFEAQQINKTDN